MAQQSIRIRLTFSFTDGTLWVTGCGSAGDNGDLNGYIDELRVVKGVAVWTSDFANCAVRHTGKSFARRWRAGCTRRS